MLLLKAVGSIALDKLQACNGQDIANEICFPAWVLECYTGQDQILHGALSGQFHVHIECCVYVQSLHHQAYAASQFSICFLS